MGWQAAVTIALAVMALHVAWIVWVIRREVVADRGQRAELAEATGLEVFGPMFWAGTEGAPLVHVRRAPTGTKLSSGTEMTVWAIELMAVASGTLAAPALLVRKGSWASWSRPVNGRFRMGPRLIERNGASWFALYDAGEGPVGDEGGSDALGLPWPAEHIEAALLGDPDFLKAELIPGRLVERPAETVLITTHHREVWDTEHLRSALLASQRAFGWAPRHPEKLAAIAAPTSSWGVPLYLGAAVGLLVGLTFVLESDHLRSGGTILMGLAVYAGVTLVVTLGVAAVQALTARQRR